ncbi:GNAT family N-acetyltransferase [bacterium]|nr:GNAT family N-acetyltransferase [bacterium]MCI0604284.1 GNAT family N-acetyltransferase [bacterium]
MKTIERLTHKEKAEVVDVLTAAFRDYPVMRFILQTDGTEYETKLKAIMGFYTSVRLAKDRPVLGIRENDTLVASALVDESSLKPWAEMQTELNRLKEIIGEDAYSRLELFERLTGGLEPISPHHFLGMIGVRPEYRGKGFARPILESVKQMSIADPISTGVCLNTEDAENVPFYEHFGYKVIGEVDIENLHSWCMFLQTR